MVTVLSSGLKQDNTGFLYIKKKKRYDPFRTALVRVRVSPH